MTTLLEKKVLSARHELNIFLDIHECPTAVNGEIFPYFQSMLLTTRENRKYKILLDNVKEAEENFKAEQNK